MTGVDFGVLGPIEVLREGRPVRLAGARQRTVLATLLLAGGRVVPVARMVRLLWGESPPPTARTQVRKQVAGLRAVLGADRVRSGPDGYAVRLEPGELDLDRFHEQVRRARAARDAGRGVEAAAALRAATALWRGPALAGGSPELVDTEAPHLEELRLAAVTERIAADLDLGRHGQVIGELTRLVRRYPLRERLRAQLMLALHRSGRTADGLAVYREGRAALSAQLGVEPGDELRELHRGMLTGDASLAPTPDRPAEPPSCGRPAELPAPEPDLVGRTTESDAVRASLTAGRVTVVHGRGGTGKTALAVRVAHALSGDFPDGQLFVDVGERDPADVLGRLLRALGCAPTALPATLEERAARYRTLLDGRRLLVVLDDAHAEAQVAPLLPGSAACGVLVTSRGRLGVLSGAARHRLGPLPAPDAVELLARVAGPGRVAAEPAAAATLVARCGHLPLAVRIAGVRLAARPGWTVARLARRLDDPDRRLDELVAAHLDVRAVLARDHAALDEPLRHALRVAALLPDGPFAPAQLACALGVRVDRAEDLAAALTEAGLLDQVGATPTFRLDALVRADARRRAGRRVSACVTRDGRPGGDDAAPARPGLTRRWCPSSAN
ncbi:BTAD domain-containing putative transcriptional regulator [Micromonospora sp. NPDC047465]|uniref:AfsR/SARP family transcriptional regulator n=1 Tax=Micromonospora sp. NPDC047465 TaxID=3154813 RepID=UPI0033FBEBC2